MLTMARTRKRKPAKAEPPKRSIASFKGSEDFAAWFEALVKRERIPASSLIEKALVLYADSVGFPDPPPER